MPTTLPSQVMPAPDLTIGQAVRFFVLLNRSRVLHRRLEAAHRRLDRETTHEAGDELLRAAERWLACHEEIGALLGLTAAPHVEEMRAVLLDRR